VSHLYKRKLPSSKVTGSSTVTVQFTAKGQRPQGSHQRGRAITQTIAKGHRLQHSYTKRVEQTQKQWPPRSDSKGW
jgi:hypothetical protein